MMITFQMWPTQVELFLQFSGFSAPPPSFLACLPRCLVCSPEYHEDEDMIIVMTMVIMMTMMIMIMTDTTPLIGRPDCEEGR